MATLTRNELAAAVAAIEWIAKRNDLATVLNKMPAMLAEKKLPTVTAKGLKKAINFLTQAADRAAQAARIAKGMKIKEWLKAGELDGTERDTKELLTTLGGMLDAASVDAIVGPNLFEGSDGTYYTVVVEASIEVASDEFVNDVLQEVYEEGEDEEPPERNDGEPGPADVLAVTVTAQMPGQPPAETTYQIDPAPPGEVVEELCGLCDHFIEPNYDHEDDPTLCEYLHLSDGEHHDPDSHHNAVPRGTPKTSAQWKKERPDLTRKYPDGLIGPNSEHHKTKLGEGGPTSPPAWETNGTTPIGELLDRVEAEAVAGADAETHARSDFILQTAAVAVDRAVTAAEVKAAWDKFGTWDAAAVLDHLRQLSRVLGATMGMGEHTSDELLQVGIVAGLRSAGVDSVAALDDAAALETQFETLTKSEDDVPGGDQNAAASILQIAAAAGGCNTGDARAELLEAVTHAWAEYGGWHLPTLKQELAERRGLGHENLAFGSHRLELMAMVIALREAGIESVDVLKTLKKNEDTDAGTQLP